MGIPPTNETRNAGLSGCPSFAGRSLGGPCFSSVAWAGRRFARRARLGLYSWGTADDALTSAMSRDVRVSSFFYLRNQDQGSVCPLDLLTDARPFFAPQPSAPATARALGSISCVATGSLIMTLCFRQKNNKRMDVS